MTEQSPNTIGDRFIWRAVYRDGTELCQIEQDGTKNAYYDIDQSKLGSFQLWDGEKPVLDLSFTPGERLVWRRRVEMSPGGIYETAHIVGKRRKTGEHAEEAYVACVFESDGRVLLGNRFDPEHPWLYPPQYQEHES